MAHLGMVGAGVMGSAFALNLAEKGHDISMLGRSPEKMERLAAKAKEQNLKGEISIYLDTQAYVDSLPQPRAILALVPAGRPTDALIEQLKPHLSKGDLIADLGNSYYKDTERRFKDLESVGLRFLGMGISGGEEGARHGPSIMAGGSQKIWEVVEGPLKDAAAAFEGEPCCDWFGPGGSGHFIKMIHNGIEYADMQQIAEAYGIMRDGLGMSAGDIAKVFRSWMNGPLNSYLIEIAGEVAGAVDPKTGKAMLDLILDSAGQKGTGRWSVVEALHLGASNSLIAAAVEARNLSAAKDERVEMETIFGASPQRLEASLGDQDEAIALLEQAMIAAKVCAYVQGFEILDKASKEFEWSLDLAAISRVWRAGCIIRSVFLDEIAAVFDGGGKANLALADVFQNRLKDNIPALQHIVSAAVAHGLPSPAMFAALSFHNTRRTGQSTANMIQGLRDYFGAHTFERLDNLGHKVNGPWHD